jgi:hypothetical protein
MLVNAGISANVKATVKRPRRILECACIATPSDVRCHD